MRLILMGPPGAGKGTQAKHISAKFGIPHISTGDIFMKNISGQTELGEKVQSYLNKGHLVPDALTIDLVRNRLLESDALDGFLLDGFPRTLSQGEALMAILEEKDQPLHGALFMDVPVEEIKERMEGRRICGGCGASYHTVFNPPLAENKCTICGEALHKRKDDREEAVMERLKVYKEMTRPLIDFFRKRDILICVDGSQSIEDVTRDIFSLLSSLPAPHKHEGFITEVNGS